MNKLSAFFKKNSPAILTGIGIASMVSGIIFAVKATPKALEAKEKAEKAKGGKLTKIETVKTCGKYYIPTIASAVVSAGCSISAHQIHTRRQIALTTAYSLSESMFKEYKEHVVKEIGEGKEKKIVSNISEDRLKETPASTNTVYITGRGESLCFDPISSTYFNSDIEKVRKGINDVNQVILCEGYASVNDYLEALDIPLMDGRDGRPDGDSQGWGVFTTGIIDPQYDAIWSDDGRPCFTIFHRTPPAANFRNIW